MQYNPKLKKAIKEIHDVLNKYDIAGLVLLHTPGHGEFVLKINPSYSALKFEDQYRVRLKAKAEDFKDGEKGRDKALTDTSNMLQILYDMGSTNVNALYEMSSFVNNAVKATHGEGKITGDQEQNN